MRQNRSSSRHTPMRPTLHALEKRLLLNAALPQVKHLAVHAEVSTAGHAPASKVSDVKRVAKTQAKPVSIEDNSQHNDKGRAKDIYVQTNLVSDIPGMAPNTDPNLQGAWGVSFSTKSAFRVSDQAAVYSGSGASSVYRVSGTPIPTSSGSVATIGVANEGGAPASTDQTNGPTGQVSTGAPGITTSPSSFLVGTSKATVIFANLDGSISGWNGGASSTIEATVPGASFTGLAIGNTSKGVAQIYAADQDSGNIDIFNSKWQLTGTMSDPNFANFPAGYAAFNVQNLRVNGKQTIFVTYANQLTGGGIVDEFSTNGAFIKTLINDPAGVNLDSPWGLAIAPAGWGQFGGDLLVGNNNANSAGFTEINAYNLKTGAFAGTLMLNSNQPFSETELWAISFGNGAGAGSTHTLFFTAGLPNNTDGLFGAILQASVH
jgi:uncharacterized protein (TIGR03118 family)